jgi:class 3 adenylate cyclase/tetratricopeptide (TPR) repeat protein
MRCPSCHGIIEDGVKVCWACGTSLTDCCQFCGTPSAPNAKFCVECGQPLAGKKFEASLPSPSQGGRLGDNPLVAPAERRQLTVMFIDLVGSTILAARLDPEDLREAMGTYQRCVADAIARRGGLVGHFLGDGAPVYFGYPIARADDAERAVRAGLDIVEAVSGLKLLDGYEPQVRIGIATGLCVVCDNWETGAALELDVTGQTLNLAARLQAQAEPNSIIIAASTRRLSGEAFSYKALGAVPLKGFPEPIMAWRVVEAIGTLSRFEAHRRFPLTPLVGRDRELEAVQRRWRQARAGNGQIVHIVGEPGIGKSRLAVMLQERIGPESHARLRYFCSTDGQSTPFHPCIGQIEHAAGFAREDSPAVKLDKLISTFAPISPAADIAALADLLSLPADGRLPPLEFDPRMRRTRTIDTLLRVIEVMSRRQPLLIVVEDAQWIDPTSRELLNLTVERLSKWPILLLVISRAEFQADWTDLPNVSRLTLRPLDRRHSTALIRHIATGDALADSAVSDIVERADGVPLFLEELTMAAIEARTQPEDGRGMVVPMPYRGSEIPAALQASIMERLDRLGSAREIAHIGAAIGRGFSFDLVAAVAQRSDADLEWAFKRLMESGLVVGRQSRHTYQFKHVLIRDVAYGTMLRDTRRALHRRIAEALEHVRSDVATTQPQVLAFHCTEAGLPEKALAHWIRAGQQALKKSAMLEAISCLRKGLELFGGIPEGKWRNERELELQLALGSALIATKGYVAPETIDSFSRARDLCKQLNQSRQLVSVMHGQWVQAIMCNELVSARQQAADLLELGERTGDDYWRWTGHRLLGTTCFPMGDFVEGHKNFERSLSLHQALGAGRDAPPKDDAHAARLMALDEAHVLELAYDSWTLLYLGHLDQARRCRDEALRHAHNHSRAYTLAHAANGRAFIELMVGSPRAALAELQQLETLTGGHEIMYYSAMGAVFRGWCLAAIGAPHEGITLIKQGIRAYRAMGALLYVPSLLKFLAEACGMAQRGQEGLDALAEAAEIVRSAQAHHDEAEILRVRGDLMASIGDVAAAEQCLLAALSTACRQEARLLELRAAVSFARFWRDRGNAAAGRGPLVRVLDWFSEGHDTAALVEARAIADATV